MKTKDLKPGMLVFHREWDRRTSDPMGRIRYLDSL